MDKILSFQYYQEIMNQVRDIILIMQADGAIIDANTAAVNTYGYTLSELKTLTIDILHDPDAWHLSNSKMQTAFTAGIRFETIHRRKDGSNFTAEVTSHRLKSAADKILIHIIRDITELENIKNSHKDLLAKNLSLEKLASTDRLTGLWNRRHFENTILCEIERTKRYGLPLSLILFDIDCFKNFNDRYGHQAGDNILLTVSDIIRKELRTNDIFARWGGDEFTILLPNTNTPAAWHTAEKIRSIIDRHKASPLENVTLSMGVAEYIANEPIAAWLKRADDALYLAKKSGRNAVESAV